MMVSVRRIPHWVKPGAGDRDITAANMEKSQHTELPTSTKLRLVKALAWLLLLPQKFRRKATHGLTVAPWTPGRCLAWDLAIFASFKMPAVRHLGFKKLNFYLPIVSGMVTHLDRPNSIRHCSEGQGKSPC